MIVLDTNVISEVLRPRPSERVLLWLSSVEEELATTAITIAEIEWGIDRLPEGARKNELDKGMRRLLAPFVNAGLILPFSVRSAPFFAEVRHRRESAGTPIAPTDAFIAAICRETGSALATRNTKDFVNAGVRLIDPWEC